MMRILQRCGHHFVDTGFGRRGAVEMRILAASWKARTEVVVAIDAGRALRLTRWSEERMDSGGR